MTIETIKIRTKLTKSLTNAIKKGLRLDDIKTLLNNRVQLIAIDCTTPKSKTEEDNK